jgi:hypothetical protein
MNTFNDFLVGWLDTIINRDEKNNESSNDEDPIIRNRLVYALVSKKIDVHLPIETLTSESKAVDDTDLMRRFQSDWMEYKEKICEPLRFMITTGSGPDTHTYDTMVRSITLDNCFNNAFWLASRMRYLESEFPTLSRHLPLDHRGTTSRKRARPSIEQKVTSSLFVRAMHLNCVINVDYQLVQHAMIIIRKLHGEVKGLYNRAVDRITSRINDHEVRVPDYRSIIRSSVTRIHTQWIHMLSTERMTDDEVKNDFIDVLLSHTDEKKRKESKEEENEGERKNELIWEMYPLLADINRYCCEYTRSVLDGVVQSKDTPDVPLALTALSRYSRAIEIERFADFLRDKTTKQQTAMDMNTTNLMGRPMIQPVINKRYKSAMDEDLALYARKIGTFLLTKYKPATDTKEAQEQKKKKKSLLGALFQTTKVDNLRDQFKAIIEGLSVDIDYPETSKMVASTDLLCLELKTATRSKVVKTLEHMRSIETEIEQWVEYSEKSIDRLRSDVDVRERKYQLIQPSWFSIPTQESDMKHLNDRQVELKHITTVPALFKSDYMLASTQLNPMLPRTIYSLIPLLESWSRVVQSSVELSITPL